MQRMAAIRTAMRGMLVDSARSLDSVPADEQVALGLSLFYWKWENRDGLPAQIVMHAPRKVLLQSSGAEAGVHRDRRVLIHARRVYAMRLGEILIQRKLITEEDLERALELQKERGDKIGKTLVDMGFIAMRDVLAALSEQLEVPLVSIDSASRGFSRNRSALAALPAAIPLPADEP